ncbi:SDR family oxidoreductase [Phyllobacterium myrsinacearum]|uniref:NAD(P)-dependent dehydrogenase (Short-subunit alcohol dehydrogenase family) n=1 Tax=Phyllobacterium myrsinacearum TaxID=28101 RepID=A0A839E922_9HYPH|nr:SDR family oxidoreductase [Phyllobacterium myrsinacearum]MBA8876371.1 NAD(P)-dependent dehydrogenase (short-subunit alcohol dehydrogenase family) [Phyllobacterium myrsinacearum]
MKKRIFVTGGASGLGREIAVRWAREGALICIGDLNDVRGQETLDLIRAAGGEGIYRHCDVTKLADLQAVAAELQQTWGGVDVVFNNAGVATAGALTGETIEQWQWVLDINLLGVVRGCQAFAPVFKAQGKGHFVNTASMAGLVHPPMMGSYNAVKAAVVAFSETLRVELAPNNIGVTVVCPSFFRTNLTESMRSNSPAAAQKIERLFEKAPITAAEIAERIYRAVETNQYLVLPHSGDRKAYWFKRLMPVNAYLNFMTKKTRSFHRLGQSAAK